MRLAPHSRSAGSSLSCATCAHHPPIDACPRPSHPTHPTPPHPAAPAIRLALLQRQLHLGAHEVVLLALRGVRAQDELLLGVARIGLLLFELLVRGQGGGWPPGERQGQQRMAAARKQDGGVAQHGPQYNSHLHGGMRESCVEANRCWPRSAHACPPATDSSEAPAALAHRQPLHRQAGPLQRVCDDQVCSGKRQQQRNRVKQRSSDSGRRNATLGQKCRWLQPQPESGRPMAHHRGMGCSSSRPCTPHSPACVRARGQRRRVAAGGLRAPPPLLPNPAHAPSLKAALHALRGRCVGASSPS